MGQDSVIFDVRDLALTIAKQTILLQTTLQIGQGEYIAVIGPNGGGKSSFVRLLLGLQKPTSGSVRIFGQQLDAFKAWEKIGYVPQHATLVDKHFPASAEDVVRMGRIAKRGALFSFFSSKEDISVVEAMEKMHVRHLKDRLIGELSGGQRQRVAIARALASNPSVLILDEPNTGVDAASQRDFYALLRKLHKEEGITILFVTHDVGVIADDITKLITINQKVKVCDNPKAQLSCQEMSDLYGMDAHLLQNHTQGGKGC